MKTKDVHNIDQVISYLLNNTTCKDEKNAKASLTKALDRIRDRMTIKVYKTRFKVQGNELWIYQDDKK